MRTLKKFSIAIVAALTLSLVAPTATPMAPAVASAATKKVLKINATKKTLNVGKTFTLKVANAKKVTWKSSKTAVATVSSKGVVSAKKSGTATITATADKKKFTCKVTVKNPALTKASFEAKDYVAGEFNMVIPKDWKANTNSAPGVNTTVIAGSESVIIATDMVTGQPAMDYASLKDSLMLTTTPEVIATSLSTSFGLTDTKVTDLVFEDHKSPLGTAVSITYTIEGTDSTGESVKVYANGYFLSIKNRYIQVETLADSIEEDYQQVLDMGTYLFDSMTIVK